jgi:glycosyltransferase involved in cell wall biosynthesis
MSDGTNHRQNADQPPSISVVMPTFNRCAQLPRVLSPLLEDPSAQDVIVVVDGCDDGSMESLQTLAESHPNLRPFWIENSGEGTARATGVARAVTDVVLLVDDDVVAAPGLISGHARAHLGESGAVVIGYMPLATESLKLGGFATRLYAREYETRCEYYEADPTTILDHLWAGNFSVRRDQALRVGLGSTEYTERYHPDRELGLRFAEAGLVGKFDRRLLAHHLHTRTLVDFRRDARSQGGGRLRLAQLNPEAVSGFSLDELSAGIPAAAEKLIHLARRPRASKPVASTLACIVQICGATRIGRAETATAQLLRRVEQTRGAIARSGGRT